MVALPKEGKGRTCPEAMEGGAVSVEAGEKAMYLGSDPHAPARMPLHPTPGVKLRDTEVTSSAADPRLRAVGKVSPLTTKTLVQGLNVAGRSGRARGGERKLRVRPLAYPLRGKAVPASQEAL